MTFSKSCRKKGPQGPREAVQQPGGDRPTDETPEREGEWRSCGRKNQISCEARLQRWDVCGLTGGERRSGEGELRVRGGEQQWRRVWGERRVSYWKLRFTSLYFGKLPTLHTENKNKILLNKPETLDNPALKIISSISTYIVSLNFKVLFWIKSLLVVSQHCAVTVCFPHPVQEEERSGGPHRNRESKPSLSEEQKGDRGWREHAQRAEPQGEVGAAFLLLESLCGAAAEAFPPSAPQRGDREAEISGALQEAAHGGEDGAGQGRPGPAGHHQEAEGGGRQEERCSTVATSFTTNHQTFTKGILLLTIKK